MDPSATHDHPAAALVDRIVQQTRSGMGGDEQSVSDLATRLFTSMFSVVILCDETLLNHNVLKKITFDHESWEFVARVFAAWQNEDVVPANVGQFLRFLRHSLAHGNVNLEPAQELVRGHEHGVTFETPYIFAIKPSADFNGVVVWENYRGTSRRKSAGTLHVSHMWSVIEGLQALVHNKRNWSPEAKQWGSTDWRWPVDETAQADGPRAPRA